MIRDLVDGKLITTYITNLESFSMTRLAKTRNDIAVQNRGEFFTESVLKHRSDRQRRSTMSTAWL